MREYVRRLGEAEGLDVDQFEQNAVEGVAMRAVLAMGLEGSRRPGFEIVERHIAGLTGRAVDRTRAAALRPSIYTGAAAPLVQQQATPEVPPALREVEVMAIYW